jgi:hypothetical protein
MESYSISSKARISIGSTSCFICLSLSIIPLGLEGLSSSLSFYPGLTEEGLHLLHK